MKILLVDDSRVTREVLKVYLMADAVSLFDCADGLEAMSLMKSERPDVVIADFRMPRLDGPGLCRAAAADPMLAQIPVIILSSMKDEASIATALQAGARLVLSKPVRPDALKDAVQTALAASKSTPRT